MSETTYTVNTPESPTSLPEVTKSREIFTGDINDAVIKVQQITGFEITPEWWGGQVGNFGSTEEILDRFDAAFESFVYDSMGIEKHLTDESELTQEADRELEEFDKKYGPGPEPGSVPLREEFLEALSEHLKEKYFELNVLEAEDKVLVSGTAEYNNAELARRSEEDPDTGIFELLYLVKQGQEVKILGTTHVYNANNSEIKYLDQLVRTIPKDSNKVLILEGQYGEEGTLPEDPLDAVRIAGGEFGYMAALARQKGIEVIPGEPDPHSSAEEILATNPEISRDDIALHYGVKTLKEIFSETNSVQLEAVAPYIHHSVGIAGGKDKGGWVENVTSRQEVVDLSDAQKQDILEDMPDIIQRLNIQFEKLKPGNTLLSVDPEGNLLLGYDLGKPPILWDPAPEQLGESATVLTEISRLDMLMRDKHTLRLMHGALSTGKEPIIAVGSSHVSALRPALDNYFKTSI